MGCGNSRALDDSIRSHFARDSKSTIEAPSHDYFQGVHTINGKDEERERLLQEDCKRDEERLQTVGVGMVVWEALVRQRAKMLMLQISMKFQEALVHRRSLAQACVERWRSVVSCRKAGRHPGFWMPPSATRGARLAMKDRLERGPEGEGEVIQQHHEVVVDKKGKSKRNQNGNDMDYLKMIKEDDLMRAIETQRVEQEAMTGQTMTKKQLLQKYGVTTHEESDGHGCCKDKGCVIA